MKGYRVLLLVMITLLLCSCGSIYQISYSYQPPVSSSGKMCLLQCTNAKNNCQQVCHMQDQQCRMKEHQRAYYRYLDYRQQQERLGKTSKKSINDFDNSYLKCNVSCHCTIDFNACYQGCGGIVMPHKECVAYC